MSARADSEAVVYQPRYYSVRLLVTIVAATVTVIIKMSIGEHFSHAGVRGIKSIFKQSFLSTVPGT